MKSGRPSSNLADACSRATLFPSLPTDEVRGAFGLNGSSGCKLVAKTGKEASSENLGGKSSPFPFALPTLRLGYGRSGETHRRGSLAVQLLRFLITLQPAIVPRRAYCRPSASCVPPPSTLLSAGLVTPFRWDTRSALLHSGPCIRASSYGRQSHHPRSEERRVGKLCR